MKMKNIIISTIAVLLVFFVSCTKFEQYESKSLSSAPTVTLATEAVMDSAVVVSLASSSTGFISFALFEGVGNEIPDSSALIQLNIDAMQMGSGEITQANEAIGIMFGPLEQNTIYEVFAVAQNEEGVVSNVAGPLMIKTSDIYSPQLVDIAPSTSYDPEQDTNFEVHLVFDEPVTNADASKFTFSYLYDETESVAARATVNPEDPYEVIVTQSTPAHTGDYVWLSFSDGAVADIVGNPVNAFTSGLTDEGELVGLYWRAAKEGWDIDVATVEPANGSATSDIEFYIQFEAPFVVENNTDDGSVRMIVTSAGKKTIYDVPAANLIVDDNGTTVYILKPFVPTYGESIYLEMDAAALIDGYGNPSNVIESGADGIANEDDPITEISWLISYGFTRDMIIGNYNVDGVSYWEGSDESFAVVITEDPESEDQIYATLYNSSVPILGVFNGDFATLTFNIPLADDGANWIELGDLFGDGASNSLEVYGDDHFVCHIDADGNMTTDDEYWWASYYYLDEDNKGWNNIFVASTWTKTQDAGINVEKLKSKPLIKTGIPRNGITRK